MHNKLNVAYFLCALAIVFLGGFAVGDYNARTRPTLDSAQATWEKNDSTARTLNWDGFRKGNSDSLFDCSD